MSPRLLAALCALLLAAPAGAGIIRFDEIPASNSEVETLGEQFAHMGVRFATEGDGAVWAGWSAGDPGAWGLEGSNGPAFAGFDGPSYAATVIFDAPVTGFQLDAARANGSRFGDSITLAGFLGGRLVERVTVRLGAVDEWITVGLLAEVDKVLWLGGGFLFHPYGVDNVQWVGGVLPEPELLEVGIDAMPGSERNPVRLGRPGVVPVVLYGSEELPVSEVDAESLALGAPGMGAEGAPKAHRKGPHRLDHDGDGLEDLLSHHLVSETGLAEGDTELCLVGTLLDGTSFEGCDEVELVGGGGARGRRPR